MSLRPLWQQTLDELLEPHRVLLRRTWWAILAALVLGLPLIWGQSSPVVSLATLLMIGFMVAPAGLWLTGRLRGLPIVPAIGLVDVPAFAIPIWSGSEAIDYYTEQEVIGACIAECVFLAFLLGATVILQKRFRPPATVLALPDSIVGGTRKQTTLFLGLVGFACLFFVAVPADWAWRYVFQYFPNGVFTAARTAATMAGAIGLLFLGMAHGRRELGGVRLVVYLSISILFLLGLGVSLLLSAFVLQLAIWIGGFVIGRGRVPWIALVSILLLLNLMHHGKWEMRQRYWDQFGGEFQPITPLAYPQYYREWFEAGLRELRAPDDFDSVESRESILERASLVQMFLLAQRGTATDTPYLRGETYMVVPKLLVPRLLWPDKPRTHLGQILLNVHFGRQTMEDTARTYIAWGMLAESWANFGTFGPPLLGLGLGLFLGAMTAISRGVPMGSARFLLSAVVLYYALNATQQVVSVWTTSLFQGFVVILLGLWILMRPIRVEPLP